MLAQTFRSKNELWRFLVCDGGVYLPIAKNCTLYLVQASPFSNFLTCILRASKQCVLRSQVRQAYCPQIEGLYIADLVDFVLMRSDKAMSFMPKLEEIPKAGREWVANVLYTVEPESF